MKKGGYLREVKEKDPDKFKEITKKGVETRKKKALYKKTFKEIFSGILSATVVLKDKFGNIMKDDKGNIVEITQKEALAIKSINNIKENVNIKDIKDIMDILGEVEKGQINDYYVSQVGNVRNEINELSDKKTNKKQNKSLLDNLEIVEVN
jgi:hydrogenase maturation factor